jgi:hypothetical protein
MQTYNYNIPQFNADQLLSEVYTQLNKKLVASYVGEVLDGYFTSDGTNILFCFFVDLTQQEIDILDALITNYIYNPDYNYSRFFKINNSTDNPSLIDYDIMGFNKKRVFISGELREVSYYNNYDYSANTYSDLVVLENRTYVRNEIGIATRRDLTSTWYLNDGSTGLTTSYSKYYTPEEGIQEGMDRRNNMVAFAKTTLLSDLKVIYGEPANQNYAFDLLTSVKIQMDYFTQGYTQPLRDAVSASTKPYMDVATKLDVIRQLTF